MSKIATKSLCKLLEAAESHLAGTRKRPATLTGKDLKEYQQIYAWEERNEFEAMIERAEQRHAIRVTRSNRPHEANQIRRIEVVDHSILADFLGKTLKSTLIDAAKQKLAPYMDDFPILFEVITRWEQLKSVRGTGPDAVENWLKGMQTIQYCRRFDSSAQSVPVRDASAQLFSDSKRIDTLVSFIDVLLSESLDVPRTIDEVFAELGLQRIEQPALLAGNVDVIRQRGTGLLDSPYVGFSPSAVLALDPATVSTILTVENQTTFYAEAKKRELENTLVLYTAGMPSPGWRSMYRRLIQSSNANTAILHWGDIDEGGYRIASVLAKDCAALNRRLLPYMMNPSEIPHTLRKSASTGTLNRMHKFALAAGWTKVANEILKERFVLEQEQLSMQPAPNINKS